MYICALFELPNPLTFDWDEANREKNRLGHGITCEECEEVFRDTSAWFFEDPAHSLEEERFYAYGKTEAGKKLLVSFTMRPRGIRPISVRKANARERKKYGKDGS